MEIATTNGICYFDFSNISFVSLLSADLLVMYASYVMIGAAYPVQARDGQYLLAESAVR